MIPVRTYLDMSDETYTEKSDSEQEKCKWGHLIIRDSNTAFRDYLLLGLNECDSHDLTLSIRLNEGQVRRVIGALQTWLARLKSETGGAR